MAKKKAQEAEFIRQREIKIKEQEREEAARAFAE
jgi:hypothetical protein